MNRTHDAPAWSRLHDAGIVSTDAPPPRDDTPWYLAGLIGVSAWIAAIFLFGFFATLFDRLIQEGVLAVLVGVVCCVSALVLLRAARGRDFIEQFAIAISLAGQVLIGAGATDLIEGLGSGERWRAIWAVVAAVAMAMYASGRLPMHRFLCGGIAGVALAGLCIAHGARTTDVFAPPLLAWCAGIAWWLADDDRRYAPALTPLAWAWSLVACALAWWGDVEHMIDGSDETLTAWRIVADLAMALLLPACAAWSLSRRATPSPLARRALSIGIAAALALVWFRAPGVSLGVSLALVGFASHRPALLAVGCASLPLYLFHYYGQLDVPLLEKSYWLLGGGVALLLSRVAYLRLAREEAR